MVIAVKQKLLMKILVGAAWIDGMIQTEEREYLRHKAIANGLADDKEIKSLLSVSGIRVRSLDFRSRRRKKRFTNMRQNF